MTEYSAIFQPFVDLFTQEQVQAILLAWLPTKLGSFLSGIIAVDMFLTTILASGITVTFAALFALIRTRFTGIMWDQNLVTVQIEYYATGIFGDQYTSLFYESLSWLISQQTKQLDKGAFIVQHTNKVAEGEDDCAPPGFNILPEKNQQVTIKHDKRKFHVTFSLPAADGINNADNNNNRNSTSTTKVMPSIYLTTIKDSNANVDSVSNFLNEVTRAYLESQKKTKTRSRFERNEGYWYKIQSLTSSRGLDSVALDRPQEILLRKELETFISDKDFYQRIGMPYRRGILLYGKPGTGKTSLINAISSHLSRDLYYLNLKNITDDNELSAAFSSIPANQILVLEDIDTQSKVVHQRGRTTSSSVKSDSSENKAVGPTNKGGSDSYSMFSLSTFLSCCDGHILAEGIIIIMTTNHVEVLDPAWLVIQEYSQFTLYFILRSNLSDVLFIFNSIRPGRFDLHLDLGYATHYQIAKMYSSVVEDQKAEFPPEIMSKIPDRLLPPCEVMMTMVLYRNEAKMIPQKVYELVEKYRHMKPEEIAKQMEEEAARISSTNGEKKEEASKLENNGAAITPESAQSDEKKDEIKPVIEGAVAEVITKEIVVEELKVTTIKEKDNITNAIHNSSKITCTNEDDTDSSTDVELDENISKKSLVSI
ncbi:2036_t:CDS:2 [Acaulospora morrowiae]|uniref:2036_t:CDS:1 n=1 Tax=Acaulospora morrowiae TaxID=94023 RepID=A0A9N8VSE6_9GLOM|nr:2036_t:CDS:2 [Acaulospora morrowiae]